MNQKIVIAAAAIGAVAVAAMLVFGIDRATSDTELLSHVPADTVFYSGVTDPALARDSTRLGADIGGSLAPIMERPGDLERITNRSGAAAGMLAGIYSEYLTGLAEDDNALKRFGIAADSPSAVYLIGAIPVMRIGSADDEQFWRRIDAIEERSAAEARTEKRDAIRLRRYAFDSEGGKTLELVLANRNDTVIVTLSGAGVGEDTLAMALGEKRPASSLGDTNRLQDLASKHGTIPGTGGFLDHKRLAAGLTGADDSRFATTFERLMTTFAADDTAIGTIQSEACRQDARAIASQWPYTALGLTRVDTEAEEFVTRAAVATRDSELADTLQGLRGHIPEPVANKPLAELGIGIDANQFAPTVQKLAQRFTEANFQCPSLQQAQQQVRNQPLSQLGMVSAMVGDLRGAALAINDITATGQQAMAFDVDAVTEIATAEPASLWQFIQSSTGQPADKSPQAGGEPVAVELPPTVPLNLRVAIRDNALVGLTGKAEMEEAAGEADLEPNGVLSLRYDYGEAMATAKEFNAGATLGEELPDSSVTESVDLYIDAHLDITPSAIQFDLGYSRSSE